MCRWLAGLVASTLVACLPMASRAAPGLGAEEANKVERVVAATLEEFGVPGAALAIETPEGRWVKTFGLADVESGRAVAAEDHFGIRSITKSFTVTLVLQLIAASDGAVSLDDPIGRYLDHVPNGDIISIRQLANMTSGVYNYTADPAFLAAFGADPTRAWTADELLAYAFKGHDPIVFPPGARYQYSNTNTLLLGQLVERLAGRPFARVLRSSILRPLRLRSTSYVPGVALPDPSTTGYDGLENGEPDPVAVNASGLGFAGAMASTVTDLVRWGAVLADGDLLPRKLQAQRFWARRTEGDPASPLYDRYGLGLGEVSGWWGHTGDGVGFEAAVFRQIERRETFAILLNESKPSDIPVRIFCRVLRALDRPISQGSICGGDLSGR